MNTTEQCNPFDECDARPNNYFGFPEQKTDRGIVGTLRDKVSTKIKDLFSAMRTPEDNREGYLDRI